MWVCNCKSEHHLLWHETQVYDDGICYYCGHYALDRGSVDVKVISVKKKSAKINKRPKLQEVKERREKITHLFNKGMTIREIGVKMGLNPKTVSAIKNLAGTYGKYKGLI